MRKYSNSLIDLARRFRQSPTEAEELLWKRLKNRQLERLKFKRQHRLGRYIADFYCAELRLVIELEGSIHELAAQQEYDKARSEEIESHGLKVLRIKNEDVLDDIEQVLKIILEHRSSSLPSPRPSDTPLPILGEGAGVRVKGKA